MRKTLTAALFSLTLILTLTLTLTALSANPRPLLAGQGPLKFAPNQSWEVEQSMTYSMPGKDGKLQSMTNKNAMRFKVTKLFPDGSAIVEATASQAPATYLLATAAGHTYALNVPSAEMAAMMGDSAPNDLAALKSAADTREWLEAESRSPLDWLKVPAAPLAVGKSAEMAEPGEDRKWTVARLKDEAVSGIPCEVYEAKLPGSTPLAETVWLSRKDGFIVKKKMVQGGSAPAEIVQSRLIKK